MLKTHYMCKSATY